MTSVELYKLEKQNTSSIHLFLAGMFWHAWEFSAYQFTRYFSPYKIHWKFVKKKWEPKWFILGSLKMA